MLWLSPSKVTEKAVACQLTDYLDANGLQEMFQSAYKVAQSTETALLKDPFQPQYLARLCNCFEAGSGARKLCDVK